MPRGAPRCTADSSDGEMMSFLESRQQVAPQGIGKPLRRREDYRFMTGAGNYADDMNLPGQTYAYVVRSPHAYARIAGIDVGPAVRSAGRSEEHTSELQSRPHLVCRLLLEKKKNKKSSILETKKTHTTRRW